MGFVYRKYAPTETRVTEGRRFQPMAPGALRAPQTPGEVPDISHIPGHRDLPIPLPTNGPSRPSAEYHTSQGIMHVYDRHEDPLDADRWTMALPSQAERNRATPVMLKPARPQGNYLLGGTAEGKRLTAQLAAAEAERAALVAQAEAPAEPGK